MRAGKCLGEGWHQRAGEPHAEVNAIRDAVRQGYSTHGAALYVTLEPCCTHGRTPPCTEAIVRAGIVRVVVSTKDPNPAHIGRGFKVLRRAGIQVESGILSGESSRLNESFNHWIAHQTPFVTVKSAMTLDGKIATAAGESKWITGVKARAHGMHLRRGADAILVGINTVIADNPSLTLRGRSAAGATRQQPRRIILDSMARTPLKSKVANDDDAARTTVIVSKDAPLQRVVALDRKVNVIVAPARQGRLDLGWLLRRLGAENVVNLLVEGGGEINASFLLGGFAHRIAFFYAPKILGGRNSRKAVAGQGMPSLKESVLLADVEFGQLGSDFLITAKVESDALMQFSQT